MRWSPNAGGGRSAITWFIRVVAVLLLAAPFAVEGQQTGKIQKVGVVFSGSRGVSLALIHAFEEGLQELRNLIARVTPPGDHLLSQKIYIRRDGTWQPQKA